MKKIGLGVIFVVSLVFVLILMPVSASPFIAGYVNDSFSGISADGKIITLWNSANGMADNLTDIIGPSGNSMTDNFYMIDCEALSVPCMVGDILSLKVFDTGDGGSTQIVNVSVSGAGFEIAPILMINSRPNVSLNSPVNFGNVSGQINFVCTAFDSDGNLANISLYSNFSGNFILNETRAATGSTNTTTFSKNISDGRYNWNCLTSDNLGVQNFSSNRTVTSDSTPPSIFSINANETRACGLGTNVRVSCNTTDSLSLINNVLIQAFSNASYLNHTTTFSNGIYYADILLNQYGAWNFTCISSDYADNFNFLSHLFDGVLENSPNLRINSSGITFSKPNPIESEQIIINVSIENNGCLNANNLVLGVYEGDPNIDGVQIGPNLTGNVSMGNSSVFEISWTSKIGFTNIFAYADVNHSFAEINESDNIANRSINVISWHIFYGNITADRILANSGFYNLSLWLNDTNSSGNVYVSDTESELNWASLVALGRNKSNSPTNNDFSEIDSILDSEEYFDSISNVYTTNGNTPRNTSTFTVSSQNLQNVPVVNTSTSNNFITGIVWDSSDDTNGQYDASEQEDVVFISRISRNSQGLFGNYDYEVRVPSKLREYDNFDSSEVYLYFDLN